jgi:hypothetical protein
VLDARFTRWKLDAHYFLEFCKMIKIFRYLPELDCFVVDPEYKVIADSLGLSEWNEVVWIGRYFALDNDYGEHWFDNWEQRDAIEEKAAEFGVDYDDLLVLDPDRFKNGYDGPCHSSSDRILFWKDVLTSLSLSADTLVREAIKFNEQRKDYAPEEYIEDLDERIELIKKRFN